MLWLPVEPFSSPHTPAPLLGFQDPICSFPTQALAQMCEVTNYGAPEHQHFSPSPLSCGCSISISSPHLSSSIFLLALTPVMSVEQGLRESEKVSLICGLLRQSPPGEFRQVVQDLCDLLQDDELVKQEAAHAGARHNKNNFTPVFVNGNIVLLTQYNDLGGNRFFYPQDKFSFEFDHLSGITTKTHLHRVMLDEGELWRGALHKGLNAYVNCHFPAGNCCVFKKSLGKRQMLVACIEAHLYQPSKHWNSLWKSDWTFALTPVMTRVTGIFLFQLHYFRDANLHVTVNKSVSESLHVIDRNQFVTDFVKFVKAEDNKIHTAIMENIQALSEHTWRKNLRRRLPITRTFINWNELLNNQHPKTSASRKEVPP
ncbi:F-actin-capping protein subunit alpha-2 [Meleagris gallopavo]|uniref:F-actin-capping protein subunit alpha-2 n=1 Tax=Meleagris gallopavo TaxID=9103 RepID=UPI00093C6FB4|nr:F-actin-capping protein subunit alpha-2 [Meleagris gallopavo]